MTATTGAPVLVARGLCVGFGSRPVLDGVDLAVPARRSLAVLGPSGAGKTTLLRCLAGLLVPDDGDVECAGQVLTGRSWRERARIRLGAIGLVFQSGELLDELSVAENVALPLRLRGDGDVAARTSAMLARVGMADREDQAPVTLSGGEVQRVAIARALVTGPRVILADEPTGALDEDMSIQVGALLVACARDGDAALVVATHDPLVAALVDVRIRLRAGKVDGA